MKKKTLRRRVAITPELRAKIKRLQKLHAEHARAVRRNEGRFYESGGLEELQALSNEVCPVLGIRPWDDEDEALAAALRDE